MSNSRSYLHDASNRTKFKCAIVELRFERIVIYLREVLEDDTCGSERNLNVFLRVLNPVEDLLNICLLNAEVIAISDGTLKEHADRVWQLG